MQRLPIQTLSGTERSITLSEIVLAVFAVGLLLGLWLGREDRSLVDRNLRQLEQRIDAIENRPHILRNAFRPGSDDRRSGDIPSASPGRSVLL